MRIGVLWKSISLNSGAKLQIWHDIAKFLIDFIIRHLHKATQ